MRHEKIDYLEYPSSDLQATKAFLESAFGWEFTDYGPEHNAFAGQGLQCGGGFYHAKLMSKSDQGAEEPSVNEFAVWVEA